MRTIGNGGGRWLTSISRTTPSRDSWSDIDRSLHAGILVAGDGADVFVRAWRRRREFEVRGLAGSGDDLQRAGGLVGLDAGEGQVVLDDALVVEGDLDGLADLRVDG